MGKINPPEMVKPFTGLLLSEISLLSEVKKALEDYFGPIDLESQIIPFTHSDYYNFEMGNKILRLWVSFKRLGKPDQLAEWKVKSNQLEQGFVYESGQGRILRQVNIDPGYLIMSKVVLASTKDYSHRIYLSSGIYAEVTLEYRKLTGWQACNSTYPDYKDKVAIDFFTQVRNEYRRQS